MTEGAQKVYNFIIEKIQNGEWQVHDKIWVEDQFVAHLQVTKSSVRQAVELLQTNGILQKIQGSGTYVLPMKVSTLFKQKSFPFVPTMSQNDLKVWLEFRKYFEYGNVLLFSQNAEADLLHELEQTYQKMCQYAHDPQAYAGPHHEFHNIIARGTHNEIIICINNILSDIYQSFLTYQAKYLGTTDSIEYHRDILQWLKEGDGLLAAQIMLRHLEAAEASAQSLFQSQDEALPNSEKKIFL